MLKNEGGRTKYSHSSLLELFKNSVFASYTISISVFADVSVNLSMYFPFS